jgi:peptidoglycan/LPS O-acetylase OafA/YrhL
VISGFVIPLSLYGIGYRFKDFPFFLFRRLVRLEPPYIVSIVLIIVLWHASSMAPGFAGAAPNYSVLQIASHLFYLVPLTGYSWLNPVYWSLAYEFAFYIIVGISFSYLIQRNVVATVAVALCAVAIEYFIREFVDVRVIEFLVGALLMRSVIVKDIHANAWLLISLATVFIIGGIATGTAVAIGAGGIYFFRSVDFGRWALLFGGLSYSLYLVHVPIGGRVMNLAKRFDHGGPYEAFAVVCALAASVAVAALLHQWVERPAMAASRKIMAMGHRPIPGR